jgi:hypothetical protein
MEQRRRGVSVDTGLEATAVVPVLTGAGRSHQSHRDESRPSTHVTLRSVDSPWRYAEIVSRATSPPDPAALGTFPSDPHRPSLDVIRAELDIEATAQAKRGETADARAGVVLGSAGALAGLAVNAKIVQTLPGAVAALVAAVLAAGVFLPRLRDVVDPVELRRRYARQPAEITKLQVLDDRITDFAANEKPVAAKLNLLRWAIATLVVAILLVVGGAGGELLITTAG